MTIAPTPDWTDAEKSVVDGCLKKILASRMFEKSPRQQRFLAYLVAYALANNAEPLKGYTIGIEVFDRGHAFDPNVDAIVRVEATRLRNKLREYYVNEGAGDPVQLELPKGGYTLGIGFLTRQAPRAQTFPAAQQPALLPAGDKPVLAVMPLANIGIGTGQEYLCDGITNNLIAELSRLPGLCVISRQSSFACKGRAQSTVEIGAELGAHYLLEGSVQAVKHRVRVNVQLVETGGGVNVWAERYERKAGDIFDLQDDLSRCIVAALLLKLAGFASASGEQQAAALAEARIAARRGVEPHWRNAQLSLEDARQLFLQAVEQDPSYAAAHASLARTLMFQWCVGWEASPAQLERALQHAHTAVALDGHLPHAQRPREWVRQGNKCCEESLLHCRQAVARDANNTEAYLLLSLSLSAAGFGQEALYYTEKARLPMPHPSPFYQFALGQRHFVMKDYDKARMALKCSSELCGVPIPNYIYRAISYAVMGREEEARAKREIWSALIGNDRNMIIRFVAEGRRDPRKPRSGPHADRRRHHHGDWSP